MAKYTLTIRTMVELKLNLGLDDYPIFDENYRQILNSNIINHYYFREIGVDTPEQFYFRVRAFMQLIMPKYNKMYEVDLLKYDLLTDYNLEENITGKGGATSGSNNLSVFSDTPQKQLQKNEITQDFYGSSTSRDENSINSSSNNESKRIVKGKTGYKTYPELIKLYRDNLINIDMMIIEELKKFFVVFY